MHKICSLLGILIKIGEIKKLREYFKGLQFGGNKTFLEEQRGMSFLLTVVATSVRLIDSAVSKTKTTLVSTSNVKCGRIETRLTV